MSRFPETRALAEQALRHVLDEQAKLLKRSDSSALVDILTLLNQLAINTSHLLVEGLERTRPLWQFTKEAKELEAKTDDLSEALWTPILVSVSAIYEKMEQSVEAPEGEIGLAAETRAHYHNLRIRLLEQLLGTRMLVANSDLGEENERVWIQFLERHLGSSLRVLRGGHIYDYNGSKSSQIDLIVVGADAQVCLPGDSNDGKAHVLIDQVVAAIMVTSNLTAQKLKKDWGNLQSIPAYAQLEKDNPAFKNHPWPLCYIVGAQSDPIDRLKVAWKAMCDEGHTKVVPQFVVTLDGGFLYGGLRRWPCPRYPGNYKEAADVTETTGIHAGLGLAWMVLQLQGRIAALHKRVLAPIGRFAELLDKAMMKSGVPPTWSERFNTMLLPRAIGGIFEWGRVSTFAHNRLHLMSLARKRPGAETIFEVELHVDGTDLSKLEWNTHSRFLRWFRYPVALTQGRVLAIEEWVPKDGKHTRKIAVFDLITGDEIRCPYVDQLNNFPAMEELEAEVTPFLSQDTGDKALAETGSEASR